MQSSRFRSIATRRMAVVAALTAGVVLTLTFGARSMLASGETRRSDLFGRLDPAELTPPHAVAFLEADLNAGAWEGVIERETVEALADQLLADVGLDYQTDVRPWFGGRVAVFFTSLDPASTDGAILFETSDSQATERALTKAQRFARRQVYDTTSHSYRGVAYKVSSQDTAWGFAGGHFIVGSSSALRAAIDAARSESLVDSEYFRAATAGLPNGLARLYVDMSVLYENLRQASVGGLESAAALGLFDGPLAIVVDFVADGLVVDVRGPFPAAPFLRAALAEPETLTALPADSWLALSIPRAGEVLETLIDQGAESLGSGVGFDDVERRFERTTGLSLRHDFLEWMGTAGVALFGDGPDFGLGAIIQSTDRGASRRAVDALASGGASGRAQISGFLLGSQRGALEVRSRKNEIVAAAGSRDQRAAVGRGPTLEESSSFEAGSAALGEEFRPIAFANFSGLADALLPEAAALDPVSFALFGARADEDFIHGRLVIGFK